MPTRTPIALLAIALACATLPAAAQVTVVGRDSQLNFSWFAGYAADLYGGEGSDSDGNLMAIDGAALSGSDGAEDDYPPTGNVWTATVSWDLSHQYTIDGSPSALDDATRIVASGQSSTASSFTGLATVKVSATLPGNLLALSFVNPVAQQFLFEGSVAQQGPVQRNSSMVKILDDAGQDVVIGTGGYNDSWSKLITLQPGIYTIQGSAKSVSGGIESAWARWNYSLEVMAAVPEPGTAALWAGGIAWLAWRRWRARPTTAA